MGAPTPLNTPALGSTVVQTPPQGDNSKAAINSQFLNLALDEGGTIDNAIATAVTTAVGSQKSLGLDATTPTENGTVASNPPTSAAIQTALGNLAFGSAWQNTLDYDVRLTVYVAVTANTSLVLEDGVGTSATPAQTTIVTGTVATGFISVSAKVPAGQYRLLSKSGTETSAIVGQYVEAA